MYVAHTRGFTLIELLIVMAVVGILTALAYPAYTESVRRSRRSDAVIGLMEVAQTLERCYTQFGGVYDYVDCPIQSTVEIISSQGFYRVMPTLTATTYRLTATPVADGPQAADAGCTAFTLTNTGVKTAVGSLGDACWD
ncbi:type IV pilin protein [Candidatus Thiosymbion oneisti]|uniref:type IV pilin protein n=1 Tax=Candidatus Thiosymbion oneisti TaxID=589554 RepID=UPI001A9C7DE3|nr:type IV pilin protein [Candidatus Thiosymbion oneisti]